MRLGQYAYEWCRRTLEQQSLWCDETISASSSLNVLAADGSQALRREIAALP